MHTPPTPSLFPPSSPPSLQPNTAAAAHRLLTNGASESSMSLEAAIRCIVGKAWSRGSDDRIER